MHTQDKNIERNGTAAVRRLRLQKFQNGRPFMINTSDLPSNQCYLEYPEGRIVLVAHHGHSMDFDVIRELPENESTMLRIKYNLPVDR